MTNEENTVEETVEGEGGEESKEEESSEEFKKPKLTPEQKEGIEKRQLTKLAKKYNYKPAEEEPETAKINKKGFDYAEKAFLKASDIRSDEYDFVREVMDNTGKTLDDVLETKYFQKELKERREEKGSREAIPSGSKRSTSSARDTVEYWMAKGGLPPSSDRELCQKVLNARIKKEESKSNFTDQAVV